MSGIRLRAPLAAVCGLLLLAVVLVFGQTVGHDFVNFDDDDYVYENRHVHEGLTGEGIAWAFTETHVSAHWHPLTWLSLMADAQVLRPAEGPPDRARLAAGMHLVNVALHAANALLLFLVLRAMTASVWRSALVAAVFAVHPLHVESVAWITERKDVLSGLFGLLALWAYAWYARGPSVVRYLSVAAALALGLMAKPMLVTWPLVFLLLDYWPLGRSGRVGEQGTRATVRCGTGQEATSVSRTDSAQPAIPRRSAPRISQLLVVEKIPLLLLVAASAAVTFLAQRSGGTVVSLESVPISARIARAAVLYVAYLGKTFWPVNLAAVYPGEPMESYWPALGAGVLLALLTAGALWGAWRGQRWLAVGWFWYLGTLAADDRFGPGGFAGDGRPFPVPAADRDLRGPGPAARLQRQAEGLCGGDRLPARLGLRGLAADDLFLKRRDPLDSHLAADLQELHGPQQHGGDPEETRPAACGGPTVSQVAGDLPGQHRRRQQPADNAVRAGEDRRRARDCRGHLPLECSSAEVHYNFGVALQQASRSRRPSFAIAAPWRSSPHRRRPATTWRRPMPGATTCRRPSGSGARP